MKRLEHPCTVERDARFLLTARRPFTRWSEISGREQDAFIREARRIRESLSLYEPTAFI